MLNTKNVNEIEDNNVWRKLQESASKSVIWSVKLSLQCLSDEEKVLSASSADLMLEFVHWESLSQIFTAEKHSDLTMFSRMQVRDVQFHIIVIWEMQWILSCNVHKELCAVCWRNEKLLKANRIIVWKEDEKRKQAQLIWWKTQLQRLLKADRISYKKKIEEGSRLSLYDKRQQLQELLKADEISYKKKIERESEPSLYDERHSFKNCWKLTKYHIKRRWRKKASSAYMMKDTASRIVESWWNIVWKEDWEREWAQLIWWKTQLQRLLKADEVLYEKKMKKESKFSLYN